MKHAPLLLLLASCMPSFDDPRCYQSECPIGQVDAGDGGVRDQGGEDREEPIEPEQLELTWRAMETPEAPAPRWRHAMVYSPKNRGVLLHGGILAGGGGAQNDTWLFTGDGWTELRPPNNTGIKTDHAASEDVNGNVVVFGGNTRHGGTWIDETWLWDGTTWSWLNPDPHPSARVFAGIAYDPLRKKVVLAGPDTWEWDGERWEQRASGDGTPKRENFTMWFDPEREQVLLFGGGSGAGVTFDDCWGWDGARWRPIDLSNGPGFREAYAAAFDLRLGRLILYSGLNEPGMNWLSGTWTLRGSAWTQIADHNAMIPVIFGAAAYDRASGRVVYFSGATSDDGVAADQTFVLD